MIGIVFDPAKLLDTDQKNWWRQWQQRANKATDTAIESFEDWLIGQRDAPFHFNFNSTIWTDLRSISLRAISLS